MNESVLGKPIRWTVVSYRHDYDFDRARSTGRSPRERVEVPGVSRTGVVSSAGPVPGTAWVIPDERADGEGYAVCVQVPRQGRPTARPVDVERSSAREQAAVMRGRQLGWDTRRLVHLDHGATDVRVAACPIAVAA